MTGLSFTFTDYTFSGLLSILAALYGVGYPLIVQSIGRINSQYNSPSLSERFTKEPIYIVFQIVLIINLAFSVTIPFILHAGWNDMLFITLQASFLVVLVGLTFLLFNLILTYSRGQKLLKHIEGHFVNRKRVLQIFDLAVYADMNHLYSLYRDSMLVVYGYIFEQQKETFSRPQNTFSPSIEYDQTTVDIVRRIKSFLRKDDGHHYLYRYNDIVPCFYNLISNALIGNQTHVLMRELVEEAISYNNHTWFSQYWQYSDSYAGIRYSYVLPSNSELQYDKKEFMIHHVMIGASLVHWKRYSWLNDIFFHTHSIPEHYAIIPSTFSGIVHSLREIARICEKPGFGGRPFYFNDSMGGAADEKMVFHEAVRYLSLLTIRLWVIKDRNLRYEDVLDPPSPPENIGEEEYECTLIELMKTSIEDWYGQKSIIQKMCFSGVNKADVLMLLDGYINTCKQELESKRSHPIVSRNKFNTLYEEIVNSFDDIKKRVPYIEKDSIWPNEIDFLKDIMFEKPLKTIQYSPYLDLANLSEGHRLLVESFVWCLCQNYIYSIRRTLRCLKQITIHRSQLSQVFGMIGMSEKYVSIACDDYLGDDLNADVILKCTYNNLYILVMPRNDLPLVEFIPDNSKDMAPLVQGEPFYSNIDSFVNCTEPSFTLRFWVRMYVHMNRNSKGYLLISIDPYSLEPQPLMIDWSLEDLFHLN